MKKRHLKTKRDEDTRMVACGDETISIEELTYPVVYYPGHYGAFIAFKPGTSCSQYTFCECARPVLYNYVELLKASPPEEQEACKHTRKLVDKKEFPLSFVLQDSSSNLDEFLGSLAFHPGLCHVCNFKTPGYKYCLEMYGSKFEQDYGWYKRQDDFRRGTYYSPIASASRYITTSGSIAFFDPSAPPRFPPVHYKARWLKNLELDIFIYELRIGIEYQGEQHYKPLSHWGGKRGLERHMANDAKKKGLCEKHGVRLVYFTYLDDVTPGSVYERLSQLADNK